MKHSFFLYSYSWRLILPIFVCGKDVVACLMRWEWNKHKILTYLRMIYMLLICIKTTQSLYQECILQKILGLVLICILCVSSRRPVTSTSHHLKSVVGEGSWDVDGERSSDLHKRKRKAGRKGSDDANFFIISNIDCKYPFFPPKETNSCKILEKKKRKKHSLLQCIFHPGSRFMKAISSATFLTWLIQRYT